LPSLNLLYDIFFHPSGIFAISMTDSLRWGMPFKVSLTAYLNVKVDFPLFAVMGQAGIKIVQAIPPFSSV